MTGQVCYTAAFFQVRPDDEPDFFEIFGSHPGLVRKRPKGYPMH
jgi:hypothetical protein